MLLRKYILIFSMEASMEWGYIWFQLLISIGSEWCAIKMQLTHLPPGQNGRHFADDIFRCIFVKEKFCIMIKISLKFVPKGPVGNNLSNGLDNGLAPNMRQAIIWTNADPVHWRIYAARGGDESIGAMFRTELGASLYFRQYDQSQLVWAIRRSPMVWKCHCMLGW